MNPFHYKTVCSPNAVHGEIAMKLIGGWSDHCAYYEGTDGNAWRYNLGCRTWTNAGKIGTFRKLFAMMHRGELFA